MQIYRLGCEDKSLLAKYLYIFFANAIKYHYLCRYKPTNISL